MTKIFFNKHVNVLTTSEHYTQLLGTKRTAAAQLPARLTALPSRFCGQHGEVSVDTSGLWIRVIITFPSSLSPALKIGG